MEKGRNKSPTRPASAAGRATKPRTTSPAKQGKGTQTPGRGSTGKPRSPSPPSKTAKKGGQQSNQQSSRPWIEDEDEILALHRLADYLLETARKRREVTLCHDLIRGVPCSRPRCHFS